MKMAERTHCVNGHAFIGDNFYMRGNKRICRKCSYNRVIAMRNRDPEKYLKNKRDEMTETRAIYKRIFGVTYVQKRKISK